MHHSAAVLLSELTPQRELRTTSRCGCNKPRLILFIPLIQIPTPGEVPVRRRLIFHRAFAFSYAPYIHVSPCTANCKHQDNIKCKFSYRTMKSTVIIIHVYFPPESVFDPLYHQQNYRVAVVTDSPAGCLSGRLANLRTVCSYRHIIPSNPRWAPYAFSWPSDLTRPSGSKFCRVASATALVDLPFPLPKVAICSSRLAE